VRVCSRTDAPKGEIFGPLRGVFLFFVPPPPVNHRQINSRQSLDRENSRLTLDDCPGTKMKKAFDKACRPIHLSEHYLHYTFSSFFFFH